jgi:hypothetical protein
MRPVRAARFREDHGQSESYAFGTPLSSVETVITLGRLPTMAECIGDLASI